MKLVSATFLQCDLMCAPRKKANNVDALTNLFYVRGLARTWNCVFADAPSTLDRALANGNGINWRSKGEADVRAAPDALLPGSR